MTTAKLWRRIIVALQTLAVVLICLVVVFAFFLFGSELSQGRHAGPWYREYKREREEARVTAELISLHAAQEAFKRAIVKDANRDRQGEYGTAAELLEAWQTSPDMPRPHLVVLSKSAVFTRTPQGQEGYRDATQVALDEGSLVVPLLGYKLYVWVPSNPEEAEKHWLGLGNPDWNYGVKSFGRMSYLIDEAGAIRSLEAYGIPIQTASDIPRVLQYKWNTLDE